jgi:hypothetical protein
VLSITIGGAFGDGGSTSIRTRDDHSYPRGQPRWTLYLGDPDDDPSRTT